MPRNPKAAPIIVLIIFVLLPWGQLMRSPGWENLRAVDICLILASGMALGALIASVVGRYRRGGR